MTNELRAAAETILACIDRKETDIGIEYTRNDRRGMGLMEAWELAHAYLAEHQEDEYEEISSEWFVTVGGESIGDENWPAYRLEIAAVGPVAWLKWEPYMGCDGWAIGDGNAPNEIEVMIPPLSTRGDVRRLTKALGIKLKEGE